MMKHGKKILARLLLCLNLSLIISHTILAQNLNTAIYMNAADFGMVSGDSNFNNSPILQAALDSAATIGAEVYIPTGSYFIQNTISIPAGVTLRGTGIGNNPLSTLPNKGSVLIYLGADWAASIAGSAAGISNLSIVDRSTHPPANHSEGALGALCILSDGNGIESIRLENVLLSNFTSGTALQLKAINGGGMAYNVFDAIRIRHAKTGIHILEDSLSFVNSNRFYNGAISGGQSENIGMEYGILIEGGNNNTFYGMVIEPESSNMGHLVVHKGHINADNIRIEGRKQKERNLSQIALIQFAEGTAESELNGTFDGEGIDDRGSNYIHVHSSAIDYNQPGYNELYNSSFKGIQPAQKSIPFWEISDTSKVASITSEAPAILKDHYVLKIRVKANSIVNLEPNINYLPQILETGYYERSNFGAFIKLNTSDSSVAVVASHRAENPTKTVRSSVKHAGDNEWRFIGLSAEVSGSQKVYPSFQIDNSLSDSLLDVFISTPSYSFGVQESPILESSLASSGGVINGVLTMSCQDINPDYLRVINGLPTEFLDIPHYGNAFLINSISHISRINETTSNRFIEGTQIQLLFADSTLVRHSGYLILSDESDANFLPGSSIRFLAMGDGTWKEIARSIPATLSAKKAVMDGSFSLVKSTVDGSHFGTGAEAEFLVLSEHANSFEILNSHSISRINYSTEDRFPEGTVIHLLFDQECVLRNSGYILLNDGENWTTQANASISLIANNNGTWRELSRNIPGLMTKNGGVFNGSIALGYASVNSSDYVASNHLELPLSANTFELSASEMITKINQSQAARFPAGTIITIIFNNSNLRVKHNPYILLCDESDYISTTNGSLRLVTTGVGVWRELGRNPY